jgi:hypothetical protein
VLRASGKIAKQGILEKREVEALPKGKNTTKEVL